MSAKDFDDYELGAEGFIPVGTDADGQAILTPSPIQTAVAPRRASIAAFRVAPPDTGLAAVAPYELEGLGSHCDVPADFVVPQTTRVHHDTFPADFDPAQMWNFVKK